MRKYALYFIAALATAVLTVSCSNDDGGVELDYHDPTVFFMPSDTATDSISILRRQFYEDTGSYLLFNDTLQNYFTGKDYLNISRYFTETVDIGYSVGQTSSTSTIYTYTYFTDYKDCKEVVDYMKKFILPHFNKGLMPFSWMIAKVITSRNRNSTSGNISRPFAVTGQRCIGLACNNLQYLHTDAQKQLLANRHLNVIVSKLASDNSSMFSDFYAFGQSYYNTWTGSTVETEVDSICRSHGFISHGSQFKNYYPSQSADLSAFTTLALTSTDESIRQQYGDNTIILQKVQIVREILEQLGYIF